MNSPDTEYRGAITLCSLSDAPFGEAVKVAAQLAADLTDGTVRFSRTSHDGVSYITLEWTQTEYGFRMPTAIAGMAWDFARRLELSKLSHNWSVYATWYAKDSEYDDCPF